jgi:16S rRNA (guanine(966)-N(2))-methyltransferase RsmD
MDKSILGLFIFINMRIIAGEYKGHRLFSPSNREIRPTTDRVREVCFAILGEKIRDAFVLDLFAGSGGFGIEAKSRGAHKVVFVDKSFSSIQLLQKNLSKVRFDDAIVIKKPALAMLKMKTFHNSRFDLVFCDPPYHFKQMAQVVDELHRNHMLAYGGLLIYEHSCKYSPSLPHVRETRMKTLGDTCLTFYRYDHGKDT